MRTYHLLISGMVQGVGFRYFTYKRAKKLGITGYVRNTMLELLIKKNFPTCLLISLK